MIITIDGPTSSGKSTVSKRLSKKLGILYLESGALYRALAYKTLKEKTPLKENFIKKMLTQTNIHVHSHEGKISVILDGACVDAYLRDEKIGNIASEISQMKSVRDFLLDVQRVCAKKNDLIAEGRDMGTVVFPQAQYKFYLEAQENVRIKRRLSELEGKDEKVKADKIKNDLKQRDKKDMKRSLSPLTVPENAIVIDTSLLSIDEVVQKIIDVIGK